MLLLTTGHPLRSAELAFSDGEFRTALELAELQLRSDPNSSQALLIAGLAAQELKRPDVAIRFLLRVPNDASPEANRALAYLASYSMSQGRTADAERLFRQILVLDPEHPDARNGLIYLLVLEGRIWEAQQFVLPALQSGRVDFNYLIVTGSNKTELGDSDGFAKASLNSVPNDPLPLLPVALNASRDHDAERAQELLERIIRSRPEILEAQGALGILFAESEEWDAFLAWQGRLNGDSDEHPGIWYGRGLFAMHARQREAAVRCFAEVLLRQPNHVAANHQLSQLLVDESQAIEFGNRARELIRLEIAIASISKAWDAGHAQTIVQLLESLGRDWEAAAWCHHVLTRQPLEVWPPRTLKRLQPRLVTCRTLTQDSANLVSKFNLTRFPLPVWRKRSPPSYPREQASLPASGISFTDEANASGLRFTYLNGASTGDTESMFELDGGGVAVLDYDGDHWPDLYLTQGGLLPDQNGLRSEVDRLFRNMGNDQFRDVTADAGLNETGYSQGVTVGDVNNDGFPDLYVANIGPNALYFNNGDGTFTDATSASGTEGAEWTSSCVLADINGDSFPDVYSVNYIGGTDIHSRSCLKTSRNRCSPDQFPAESDRLYLNVGDGRFEEVTQSAGIVDRDGRGLGIIAGDFDDSHRISLFVGNDMTQNFLFVNQTAARGAAPSFSERALLQGIAVDSRGVPKASMGIAVGDANGDGLFDVFVTNFYRESNSLYLQNADHTFTDGTRAANLAESSLLMLGWGTQFLDAELDGHPDLIVTNGHVHQPSESSIPYHMNPQFFRNKGQGRFEELKGATLGEFFAGKYLGRGLARLDWNRDGLEEACISHLDSPAALLLNRTRDAGHYIAVNLVGVESDRDAIGATVRVVASGIVWQRQMTAGDGYQASNQRQLVFGLGAVNEVERIEVSWTSGRRQSFSIPAVNREYVVIEGRSDVIEITKQ